MARLMLPLIITKTEFALIAAAVIISALGIGFMVQRQNPGTEAEAARQVRGMAQVARIVFGLAGIAVLVVGLVVDAPVAILGGVVLLLGAIGQHWTYHSYRR
jgi:hypothetical protein